MSTELPREVEDFLVAVGDQANTYGFKLNLKYADCVRMGSLKVSGYFCGTERILAVALGRKPKPKPLSDWLSTFVHESCHMDQCLENSRVWRHTIMGCNPSQVFEMWMNGVVELKANILQQMIMGVLYVELDCEQRSVKKIRKNKLPIDVKEYTQKANSYLYFYHMVAQLREWYRIGAEPYVIKDVWQAMPTTFDNDYTVLPDAYRKLYLEHCFNGDKR